MFKFRLSFLLMMFLITSIYVGQNTKNEKLIDIISNETDFDGSSAQLSSTQVSPVDKNIFSFERQIGDYRQLWIFNYQTHKKIQINTAQTTVNIVDLEKSDLKESNFMEDQLSWCPKRIDGKIWFAFVGAGDFANWDIYLGQIGSKQYLRLTANKAVDSQPNWSNDGNRIAFVSARTGKGDIYIIDNIKKLIKEYNFKRYNKQYENLLIYPAYKKLESKIYSSSDDEKYRIIQITDNYHEELYPAFSPSGKYLAITSKEYDNHFLNYGISLIELDDISSPERFTTSRKTESRAVWSPDGKRILYFSSRDIDDNKKDIYSSPFTEVGDPAESYKVIAQDVHSDGSLPITLTNDLNFGNSILYTSLSPNKDFYSIKLTSINTPVNTKTLFKQKSFIENVSSVDNLFVAVRQVGKDFKISINYLGELSSPKNKYREWTGSLSRNRSLLYYIGGGAAVLGGAVIWLISGGGGDDGGGNNGGSTSSTLGSPPKP